VWKYDLEKGEWIWLTGPIVFDVPGTFTQVGLASDSNYPHPKASTSIHFDSVNRKAYFLGGYKSKYFNN
jgi:hypothetical protein